MARAQLDPGDETGIGPSHGHLLCAALRTAGKPGDGPDPVTMLPRCVTEFWQLRAIEQFFLSGARPVSTDER